MTSEAALDTTTIQELGRLLAVLAHPRRLQILLELLEAEERDVNGLAHSLAISHAGVSQHLGLLRAHRLVAERREGRRAIYRLLRPEVGSWLAEGLGLSPPTYAPGARRFRDVDR